MVTLPMTSRTPLRMLWSTQIYRWAPTLPWCRNSLPQLLLRSPWCLSLSRVPLCAMGRIGDGLGVVALLLAGVVVGILRVGCSALLRACCLTEVNSSLLLTFLAPIPSSFTSIVARRRCPLSWKIFGRYLSLVALRLLGRRRSGKCLRVSLKGYGGILRRWVSGRKALESLPWSLSFCRRCISCLLFRCLLLLRIDVVFPPLFAWQLLVRCGILR